MNRTTPTMHPDMQLEVARKRNRELRNAVIAVLAAAAMSPMAAHRAAAAPGGCTPDNGDPTNVSCTGDQTQGVHSGVEFDPNTVDTVTVRDLTTPVHPTFPLVTGVKYELIGPYGTGLIHDVTVNVNGTAGTPIGVTTTLAQPIFVNTISGPGYDGRGASSGFLCAGAHSADEGAIGNAGNRLNVNLSNITVTANLSGGVSVANGAGDGGHGGGGSMCYSSEAGGVGGHGGVLTLTGTNVSITTTGTGAIGISASSSGGNGGHGGDGGSFRYGSRGGIGGVGGEIQLSGTGTITTNGAQAVGIYAVSVGGNGGDGGSSSGFGGGGNGPYGAGGGLVHVDSGYNITTLQDNSSGIAGYSLGGHGGNGGDGTFFNPSSGSGGGSGQSGDVWLRSTGKIVTSGKNSYGIVGQSIAGYAGSGGSANSIVNFGANGGSAGKGGRVDIFNEGEIVTTGVEAHGIFAESVGGGGGSGGGGFGAFYAAGGVGGSGGNGGLVFVTNSGKITATGADSRGIYAQSIGGAGGDGGDSTGIAALGGRGADTSDGDKVSVISSNSITSAAQAIYAESIGGGGGNGGDSTGWFSVGGGGGAGGKGGVVYVENHGSLTTVQDSSSAIFAHSIGGGGGNGGSSIGVGLGASFAIGGDGSNGGDGSTVTVKSDSGTIVTGANSQTGGPAGDGSSGIYAQSVGGGGGNGGFAFSGSVGVGASLAVAIGGKGSGGGAGKAVDVTNGSTITTHGDDSNAIFAQSLGGGGGNGGFAIAVTGSNGLSGALSIGGKGGGGGASDTVTVASTGANLQTSGDRSAGIFAQSLGGGGGNGGFAISGSFSFSVVPNGAASVALGGDGGGGGASSTVTVDSSSNISTKGDDSQGLFAQSVGGGGGNGGFSVAGSITTGAAINASFGGKGGGGGNGGAVTVGKNAYTTGTIHTLGDNSSGLFAQSVGGGGGNGGFSVAGSISGMPSANLAVGGDGGTARDGNTVTVRAANTIITEGRDSSGLVAQSVGGGGGNGGFAVAGAITASGAVGAGIGGKGDGGGNANTVTLSNLGDSITTLGEHSYGLFAQSVGGGGGNGGFAVAGSVSQGPAANFGMGGSGSQGGVGRDVFVTSTSAITTMGNESHALFAQSIGGGGGSGGFSVAGSMAASGGSLGAAIGGGGGGGGNAGRVFVNTIADGTGAISTQGDHASGIFAQSVGGGGGNGGFAIGGNITSGPSASLTLGGNGGVGRDSNIVFVNSGSSVSTHGNDSHGIYAQSVGGGGGDGGFAVSGSISATGSVNASLGGSGAGGGSAKDVTLLSSGTSVSTVGTHSYGIAAQSLGGGGGDGGFSVAAGISDGATANLGIGGSGSNGGIGRGVYLDSSTMVTTQGDNSHGVFAQSVGGGGGSGGFSVVGGISRANAGVSLGGKGAGGGDAGIVTLKNTASSVSTAGDHAYGVIAQSVGGGGGDGGFSVAGGISQSGSASLAMGGSGSGGGKGLAVNLTSSGNVTTLGDDAHGIFAQSVGGGGGSGGFAVSGAIGINGAVTAALGGSGGSGGTADAVTLFNSGALVSTSGDRSYGVVAQSVGGGGGDGGFAVAGSITKGPAADFSMGGSGAQAGGSGNVTLNSSSSVITTGDDSHAIFAQSVGGGGGAGGFSVSGSISADSGTVGASIGGKGGAGGSSGKVSLGTVNAIDGLLETSGDRSYGILAQSVGGGGGDGGFSVAGGISKGDGAKFSMGGSGGKGSDSDQVSVRSAATIQTSGDESHGIFAQSIGGGGGSGGFSVAGSISTNGSSIDASIGGSGAGGGNAKSVSVQSLGASIGTEGERSYGIVAQSIGGGGGDGGFSVAGSIDKQKAINFSIGGDGDVGGKADVISVLSSTNITTIGDESHGIFAQSLGGGGGSGGFSVAGSLFASTTNAPSIDVSVGGSGAGGGDAGAVTVGAQNNFVVGMIKTMGDDAHGIFAQSIGGGGGNGGFSVAGGLGRSPSIKFTLGGSAGTGSDGDAVNVYTAAGIVTMGEGSHGVFAQSLGGGGGNGGFAVTGSATQDTTSVNASIGGQGGGGGKGGDVGVTSSGNITTVGDKAFGVFAQSIGGGGGNGGFAVSGSLTSPPSGAVTKKPSNNIEFSMGGDGGSGDRGGDVTVLNSGVIETFGLASYGVLAQSQGGGGGNGGFAGSGTLSVLGTKSATKRATIATSLGGNGGDGNLGGTVDVTNLHDITTHGNDARGIYAYSVGGGGGIGGASYAIDVALGKVENNNGLNIEVAVGGIGGDGNVGGAIGVNNAGSIVTFGDKGDAIFAQSVGGGGGDGGQSQAASFDFTKAQKPPKTEGGDSWNVTASVGGNGGHANDGGGISITNSGNIETSGFYARGIVAQSVGGGGGSGANGIQGTGVDAIDTATEILDLRDKDFLKNLFDLKSWTITVGGSGGASGNGKDVSVTNSGSIVTHGLDSFGIFAQSIGGGGGEAQNFARGTGNGGTASSGINSKFALGGGGGSSGNGGVVTIDNSNNIATYGDEAHGIFAQSIGGGGGVAGNVDRGFSSANGPIPKLNIGVGIAVGQDGGGGGDGGNVTITNSGSITTHGSAAYGIIAQSIGGGGGAAGGLGNDGTFSAPVLGLQNFYGSAGGAGNSGIVTVTQTGSITMTGGNSIGIFAQSTTAQGVSKAVNVTTNGDINASGSGSFGILAQSLGKGSTNPLLSSDNIAITVNGGTIRGGGSAPPPGAVSLAQTDNERGAAIDFRDGKNNSLINRGTVGDANDLTRIAVLGEVGNETISNFGNVYGTINLGGGANSFVNQKNATLTSGTTLNIGTGGSLTNNGNWSVGNRNVVATTAVNGAVSQTNTGHLFVDLDVANSTSDRINVTGGTAAMSGVVDLNRMHTESIRPGTQKFVLVDAPSGVSMSGLTLNVTPSAVTTYTLGLSPVTSAGGVSSDLVLTMTTDFSMANGVSGLTTNERRMGNYFNSIATVGSSPSLAPVIGRVIEQADATKLSGVYDSLSPDAHLAEQSMPFFNNMRFSEALLSCRQIDGDYRFSSEGECGWMNVSPRWQRQDATASQIGATENLTSVAGGFQRAVNDTWHLGFGASYDSSQLQMERFNATTTAAHASGEGGNLGLVVKANYGPNIVSLSASGARMTYDAFRSAFNSTTAQSSQTTSVLAAHLRYGYSAEQKNWYLKPTIDLGYSSIHRDAFNETGAGATNLIVGSESNDITTLQPALELGGEFHIADHARMRLFGRAGLTRILSGQTLELTATFAGAPAGADPLTVTQALDRQSNDYTAGFDILGDNGAIVRLMYSQSRTNNSDASAATIKVSWPF